MTTAAPLPFVTLETQSTNLACPRLPALDRICPSTSSPAPAADLPSPRWSTSSTLVGDLSFDRDISSSRPRRIIGSTTSTAAAVARRCSPLDADSARRYVAAVEELNVLLSLMDLGYLGRDREVKYEVLDRAAALCAEGEARMETGQRLQGQPAPFATMPTAPRTGHHDRRPSHAATLTESGSSGSSHDENELDEESSEHDAAHPIKVKPSRLARLALGKRRAESRQCRRIAAAHQAWEALGVDSMAILASGATIPDFFHPPKWQAIAFPNRGRL